MMRPTTFRSYIVKQTKVSQSSCRSNKVLMRSCKRLFLFEGVDAAKSRQRTHCVRVSQSHLDAVRID